MVYMFLADGFEEVEALTPLDLLRRAGVEIKTVGVGSDVICGAHGIKICCDMCDVDLSDNAPDMVILPGGMPGTLNLDDSFAVHKALDNAFENGAYVAAICAAPSILGARGDLRGKEAICYPGFEDKLTGARISACKVVRDGRIITAAGMGVALDFGLELVSALCGTEAAKKLRMAVVAD